MMIAKYLADMWSAIAPAVGNHLWQSTLFAVVAGLLTLTLRKNQARARYWIWMAASLKFLVPFSLLVGAGSHLGWWRASDGVEAGMYACDGRVQSAIYAADDTGAISCGASGSLTVHECDACAASASCTAVAVRIHRCSIHLDRALAPNVCGAAGCDAAPRRARGSCAAAD